MRVLTRLNPAGMDVENWQALGISPDFARNERVNDRVWMGIVATYLHAVPFRNVHFGAHCPGRSVVCFANSVIGARQLTVKVCRVRRQQRSAARIRGHLEETAARICLFSAGPMSLGRNAGNGLSRGSPSRGILMGLIWRNLNSSAPAWRLMEAPPFSTWKGSPRR